MKIKYAAALAVALYQLFSFAFSPSAQGGELTCRELSDSYVEADNAPVLMDTTAYIHGEICSHGDRVREGIVASAPEWYGSAAIIYRADPDGEGGFALGDLIGIYEVLDTGYGKSTGDGVPSKVRPDKGSRGSIESGKHIDVYQESMGDAREWMELTGGKCYVQIIRDAKG